MGAFRVLVVTNLWPTESDPGYGSFVRAQMESLRPLGVEYDLLFINGRRSRWNYLRAIGELRRRLKRRRYDLIHAHFGLSGLVARCQLKLPVVVFTDGDPWSFRIFASVAYGAIKTAHLSSYLTTPNAEFLGVTASDIENYDLPSDKLSEQDVRALEAELTDPRFGTAEWRAEIELMLKNGKKAEQQSLAKYGLNYVTEHYLPEKLTEMGVL